MVGSRSARCLERLAAQESRRPVVGAGFTPARGPQAASPAPADGSTKLQTAVAWPRGRCWRELSVMTHYPRALCLALLGVLLLAGCQAPSASPAAGTSASAPSPDAAALAGPDYRQAVIDGARQDG